jgi:hypothetical protein
LSLRAVGIRLLQPLRVQWRGWDRRREGVPAPLLPPSCIPLAIIPGIAYTIHVNAARSAFDKLSEDGRALLRGYVEIIIDGGDSQQPDNISFYLHDPNQRNFAVTEQRDFTTKIDHNLDNDSRKKLIEKIMNYLVDELKISTLATDFEQFDDQKDHVQNYLSLL